MINKKHICPFCGREKSAPEIICICEFSHDRSEEDEDNRWKD